VTVAEREVLEHEAAHCAAALSLGLKVSEVDIASDVPGRLGSVTLIDPFTDIDVDRARRLMKMVLAPASGGDGDVPSWPLRKDRTADERLLATLAEGLDLDESGYRKIVTEMWELTLTRKFARVYRVIECWLEHTPRMNHEAIVRAMVIAWVDGDE